MTTEALPSVTVDRADIDVTEQTIAESFGGPDRVVWYATLHGRLSTGEQVRVVRRGGLAAQAIAALEDAIAGQGWEITNEAPL
jgi:hypothetical protein